MPLGLAEIGPAGELLGDLARDLHPDRLRFVRGGDRPVGLAGQQVGHRGANGDPADLVVASEGSVAFSAADVVGAAAAALWEVVVPVGDTVPPHSYRCQTAGAAKTFWAPAGSARRAASVS